MGEAGFTPSLRDSQASQGWSLEKEVGRPPPARGQQRLLVEWAGTLASPVEALPPTVRTGGGHQRAGEPWQATEQEDDVK